jgi:transcriptional regulator with XRE-family HTH domain
MPRVMSTIAEILSLGIPSKRFGEILSDARRAARLSIRETAQRSGITASLLGDYERGKAEPSVQHLRSLLEIYKIEPDDLVPRRDPPQVDMVRRTVTVGTATRAVGDSRAAASAMLRHDQALHLFVELVRQARSTGSRSRFTIREADAEALAELLDLEEAVVVMRLMQIMGCSEREATSLWQSLRKAQSVGVAAAILAASTLTFAAVASGDSKPVASTSGDPTEIAAGGVADYVPDATSGG